jgi:purine catabolism regulator
VQRGTLCVGGLYTLSKMSITIRDLLELPGLGLKVVAGGNGLDRPIRSAHTSELQDPTPWLSGGELLLTTGMALKGSAALQRSYIRRLVAADLAGLGFGVGFGFDTIPPPIARAAERDGFPVLEVPYPVPFIAIAEAVSSSLAEDRVRDASMSVDVHERLAFLVSDGAGPADVLDEMTGLAGGWAILYDLRGDVRARADSPGSPVPDAASIWSSLPPSLLAKGGPQTVADTGPEGTRVALAVVAGKRNEGVLVFGKAERIGPRDRIVVHHGVTVLGLLLTSRRAVIQAERRVAGDILNEAWAGRLTGPDLERRLDLVGFPAGTPVTVLVVEPSEIFDAAVLEEIAVEVDSSLGGRARTVRTTVSRERITALVNHPDPVGLARSLAEDLRSLPPFEGGEAGFGLRVGVGSTALPAAVRDSYLAALFALRASSSDAPVASPEDLGSYGFLLGSQPRPVLEGFVRSVLGPVMDRDRERSSDLLPSLRAFVQEGGRWEPGAESLGVHRHTLRYRVHQAEDLLGRDLSRPENQFEIWLALKAAEVLDE